MGLNMLGEVLGPQGALQFIQGAMDHGARILA